MSISLKSRQLNDASIGLFNSGRIVEAGELQRQAIEADGRNAAAYNNFGITLTRTGRIVEAKQMFERAAELKPDCANFQFSLGENWLKLGRFDRALEKFHQTLALDPKFYSAWINASVALGAMGRVAEAIEATRKAVEIRPDFALTRANLGVQLLMTGQFAEGWREYEHRLTCTFAPRKFKIPQWTSQSGQRVFVWAEQGVGDEILYASMLAELQNSCADVVWEADRRLIPLLARSFPGVRFVVRGLEPPADCEAHCPAGNLGQFFRSSPDQFRRTPWLKPELITLSAKPTIGISWRSSAENFAKEKSTALSEWVEILRTPGVRFINLQYGATAGELDNLKSKFGLEIEQPQIDLKNDLDGLAWLISSCSRVITVSSVVAHLAGALGVPTWVLVSAGTGKFWYWGLQSRTPFYPSVELIRQKLPGDWGPALALVKGKLHEHS